MLCQAQVLEAMFGPPAVHVWLSSNIMYTESPSTSKSQEPVIQPVEFAEWCYVGMSPWCRLLIIWLEHLVPQFERSFMKSFGCNALQDLSGENDGDPLMT